MHAVYPSDMHRQLRAQLCCVALELIEVSQACELRISDRAMCSPGRTAGARAWYQAVPAGLMVAWKADSI
jgi:hypothetical protein